MLLNGQITVKGLFSQEGFFGGGGGGLTVGRSFALKNGLAHICCTRRNVGTRYLKLT